MENGFDARTENRSTGRSDPTLTGKHFRKATIDSLPVKSTTTQWSTVIAEKVS